MATLAGCTSALGAVPTTPPPPSYLAPNATLRWVIDGDTIDVTINGTDERVRLIGIDTPETKKPDTPVQCYGHEATMYTESLLSRGTPLYIERDVVARDDYGRLLGYVYRSDDALFVNEAIIRQGYARLLTIPPNVAHESDFVAANKQARMEDLGLWKNCAG